MIAVEELYKDSAAASNRPIVVFNGELDRIRSGCILVCNYDDIDILAVLVLLLSFLTTLVCDDVVSSSH